MSATSMMHSHRQRCVIVVAELADQWSLGGTLFGISGRSAEAWAVAQVVRILGWRLWGDVIPCGHGGCVKGHKLIGGGGGVAGPRSGFLPVCGPASCGGGFRRWRQGFCVPPGCGRAAARAPGSPWVARTPHTAWVRAR
jgi:hypothetical protein